MEPTSGRPGVIALIIRETDTGGRVAMVAQWRYAQGRQPWELPRGFGEIEDTDPLESAVREVAEEAGLTVESATPIGEIVTDSSVIAGRVSVFLIRSSGQETENTEETDGFYWIDIKELASACRRGEVVDSFTVATLGLAACRDDARRILRGV